MIPFNIVISSSKCKSSIIFLCIGSLKVFKNYLLMASLPREVDSWSSGEVWRKIVEGIEDLESAKLTRHHQLSSDGMLLNTSRVMSYLYHFKCS